MRRLVVRLCIKEVLEQQGRTKTWLSHRTELAYNTVLALTNEADRDVTLETLRRIAEVLDVKIADLYTEKWVDDK